MSEEPIIISKIQVRLAVELAVQEALRKELARQVAAQVPSGWNVTVEGCSSDCPFITYPKFDVAGRPVIYVD